MKIDVIMPQMGESIAEGTIIKWLKKVGDRVQRDEPIFEISTDKVDAEIPSPSAGTLAEIKVAEGATVAVQTVVALIETEAGAVASAPAAAAPAPAAAPPAAAPPAPVAAAPVAAAPVRAAGAPASVEELRRTKSSPVVRKIAAEHGIEIASLSGSGIQGRVTKKDIVGYVESGAARPAAAAGPRPAMVAGKREPMTTMRKKIAEHMILSRRTSAHVTALFEIDFSNIARQRAEKGKEFEERYGVKLTYTPIIAAAVVEALKDWPVMNASVDGDDVIYHAQVNLGIAVALDWGLIVPVIKNADEKNIAGIARAVNDLADRARRKKLTPDEVSGGTFTITNPGSYGALFGTPIINQPQVAIMGVGTIEKRPVVINDAIAIRTMAYLSISFDHRLIDGAVADQFMSDVKKRLETFQV
jgi:2-oxoglutarate dehydrogenase E2 component (dihydrolipoamide succinyltransferase)